MAAGKRCLMQLRADGWQMVGVPGKVGCALGNE